MHRTLSCQLVCHMCLLVDLVKHADVRHADVTHLSCVVLTARLHLIYAYTASVYNSRISGC